MSKFSLLSKKNKSLLTDPLDDNNPVTVQVLGICSALAITVQLKPAVVMALSVIFVMCVANVVVSLLRKLIPSRIRIIVQLVVIASLVILVDEVFYNKEDIKLIDDKGKKVISDFIEQFEKIDQPTREVLEPIVNNLIKVHSTNFKGVGQPLRIVLTGSKFGPGVYDIILSLDKKEVLKRLTTKIT